MIPPQPKRIQRSRAKGTSMPEGAIYVGRPSKWGNPYKIGACLIPDAASAVEVFRANLPIGFRCDDLRGRDLACWCRLCPTHRSGKSFGVKCKACAPCHADVLGVIANA